MNSEKLQPDKSNDKRDISWDTTMPEKPLFSLFRLFAYNTKEKIVAVCFIIFLALMFFGMFTNPKEVATGFILSYREAVPTGAPVLERIEGAIESAESAANEGAFLRKQYVEGYGLAQLLMNKKVITDFNYGSLYKTRHDQVIFAVGEKYVDDSCTATFELVNTLLSKKIPFLYVQLPFKIPPTEYQKKAELPVHITDYSNANATEFVEKLVNANVDVYDLRDDFWQSGYTQNELFFNTDHHWTIEGAFLTTRLISNYLNKEYDFGIEPELYTDANFTKTYYKDYFLGSMGRRVGKIYGGLDDFTLITPSFDTDLTLTEVYSGSEQVFSGSFEDAVLVKDFIADPDISTNRYGVYHGDNPELRFINENASSDKKILIIKDSFGIPIYSFLSLGIREVRAIDLRLFERNVAKYAEEYNPDLVILMYNADCFSPQMFDFHLQDD